ncbi:peptidylprolyl isomerase [Actinocorallia sp. A-T 12471]|uniref:peptidylprolyl isomerase n=1 Tax=Actinocorallia sp. A-T 12471 TaxID=3089813 RepID=UPI0029D0667A|nr:peptidylprolyl isomerase [Actinocorallia sp. A-T 12471]MDX6740295.1 peptidylprolyl isomerase [Actinocorallia sp. A-T 12471]
MAGKDRKKELARQRFERQQARREAELKAARKRSVIGGAVATAVVILGVAGVFWFVGRDDDPVEDPTVAAPTAAPGECLYTETGDAAKDVGLPPAKPAYDGTVKATIKTNVGDVKVDLDGAKAPCTVNAITFLAQEGYFDGTECHRVAENPPMLQCGDPTGTGSGGPGFSYMTENTEGAKYTEGVLAMANSGSPDSNGSQFFLMYDDSELSPDYTVFGKVTSGIDVVKDVAKAGNDNSNPAGGGKPNTKVEIKSISIEKN